MLYPIVCSERKWSTFAVYLKQEDDIFNICYKVGIWFSAWRCQSMNVVLIILEYNTCSIMQVEYFDWIIGEGMTFIWRRIAGNVLPRVIVVKNYRASRTCNCKMKQLFIVVLWRSIDNFYLLAYLLPAATDRCDSLAAFTRAFHLLQFKASVFQFFLNPFLFHQSIYFLVSSLSYSIHRWFIYFLSYVIYWHSCHITNPSQSSCFNKSNYIYVFTWIWKGTIVI